MPSSDRALNSLPEPHGTGFARLRLWCLRLFLIVLLTLLAAYAGDWALWRIHLTQGNGYGSIVVTRLVVAPLKNGREEYFPDGAEDESCSRSLFPQNGLTTCWWLQRHRVHIDR